MATASAVPPPERIRSASASMRSVRRAASETAAPASAQASAVASPMPEDAPVTATTRPERPVFIGLTLGPGYARGTAARTHVRVVAVLWVG